MGTFDEVDAGIFVIKPPSGKRGRPRGTSVWDVVGLSKICELARLGMTQAKIAETVGPRTSGLLRWLKQDVQERWLPFKLALAEGMKYRFEKTLVNTKQHLEVERRITAAVDVRNAAREKEAATNGNIRA